MKIRKLYSDPPPDEILEDTVGTKVLYNWLYQKEEENYYLNERLPDLVPDFSEDEALFVECASFSN